MITYKEWKSKDTEKQTEGTAKWWRSKNKEKQRKWKNDDMTGIYMQSEGKT